MYTIDASVHINALNPAEAGSAGSQAFLTRVHKEGSPVFSPALLLVEVAAAVARAFDSPAQGIALAKALRLIPGQTWVALDEELAGEASTLGAEHRLRGADAVYAAVARHYKTTLVTADQQQIQRLSQFLDVRRPDEVTG
jgi:predicted nucleic acid-binding protein